MESVVDSLDIRFPDLDVSGMDEENMCDVSDVVEEVRRAELLSRVNVQLLILDDWKVGGPLYMTATNHEPEQRNRVGQLQSALQRKLDNLKYSLDP